MILDSSSVPLRRRIFAALLPLSILDAQGAALGDQYPITSYLTGTQDFTSCAKAQNGDRLLLWKSADANRISMLKRTDADGRILGPSEHLALGTDVVSVSANKVGNFVVLRTVQNGAWTDLYATVYNRAGSVIVPALRVNDSTQLQGATGVVTMAPNGSFSVAWLHWANFNPQRLMMKRFSSTGAALSYESQIASGANIGLKAAGSDAAGNVIVTYWSQDSSQRIDTWHSRYVASTKQLSAPARVNLYTGRAQIAGSLSMNTGGNYAISWSTLDQDGPGYSVYVQIYSQGGARLGLPVKVSAGLSSEDTDAKVALFDNNSYAVTWNETASGANHLKTRLVDGPNGGLTGAETTVTAPLQYMNPFAMCSDSSGSYSIAWRNYQTGAPGEWSANVLARDYAAETMPLIEPMANNQQNANLSAQTGTWKYYKVTVPANMARFSIATASQTTPASGNADLYVRYAGVPTASVWDIRRANVGNNESVLIGAPPPGAFYIGVFAQTGYAATSLTVSYY